MKKTKARLNPITYLAGVLFVLLTLVAVKEMNFFKPVEVSQEAIQEEYTNKELESLPQEELQEILNEEQEVLPGFHYTLSNDSKDILYYSNTAGELKRRNRETDSVTTIMRVLPEGLTPKFINESGKRPPLFWEAVAWKGSFTNNGQSTYFVAAPDGQADIYSVSVSNEVKRITNTKAVENIGYFSPDGKKVVVETIKSFGSGAGYDTYKYVYDLDTNGVITFNSKTVKEVKNNDEEIDNDRIGFISGMKWIDNNTFTFISCALICDGEWQVDVEKKKIKPLRKIVRDL